MFQKQPAVRKLLYTLLPLFVFAIFFYGLMFLLLSVVCFATGVICQYILTKVLKNKPVMSDSVLLVCMLYTLFLPPALPLWIAAIGISFGIFFCNLAPGSFGKNPINQAIISWLLIYIVFYAKMTSSWVAPSIFGLLTIDGISSATPLFMMRDGILPDLLRTFSGLKAGAAGEGPVMIILFAALYLFYAKITSWKVALSALTSFFIVTGILFFTDFINAFPPVYGIMSGSILFGAIFMTKNPSSVPLTELPADYLSEASTSYSTEYKTFFYPWGYGIFIGITIALIRTFTPLAEGTNIAILFGNIFLFLTAKAARR